MKVYTYSEARQKLATVLEQARMEGAVRIRRSDGQSFVLSLLQDAKSPLDVEGVDLGLSSEEIVAAVHERLRDLAL